MGVLPITMLKKLIPLLDSDQDGEVVAAARAIQRALKTAGCDFHDLTKAINGRVQETIRPTAHAYGDDWPTPRPDWPRQRPWDSAGKPKVDAIIKIAERMLQSPALILIDDRIFVRVVMNNARLNENFELTPDARARFLKLMNKVIR